MGINETIPHITTGKSMTLMDFMASPMADPYREALQKGDVAVATLILNSFGAPVNQENIDELTDIAIGTKAQSDIREEQAKKLRKVMNLDPKDLAIRGLVAGGTELMHGLGDAAENNGNRLASAIMAMNRTNSARQNDLYGPSSKEKNAEAWGHEQMRRGQNASRALHGIGNVIDKVFGMYNQNDYAGRLMQAAELGTGHVPSSTYDAIGRHTTANKK